MNHHALVDTAMDGFPELVDALHDALVDLLGEEKYDIDYPALAVELADTAWRQLRPEVTA